MTITCLQLVQVLKKINFFIGFFQNKIIHELEIVERSLFGRRSARLDHLVQKLYSGPFSAVILSYGHVSEVVWMSDNGRAGISMLVR